MAELEQAGEFIETEFSDFWGGKQMNLGAIVEARGVAKGIKQGVEKGVKKGREELQREIARKLLVSGADQRFVEELTGLSSAVVAQLQEAVETA